jgi:hypothetical protein
MVGLSIDSTEVTGGATLTCLCDENSYVVLELKSLQATSDREQRKNRKFFMLDGFFYIIVLGFKKNSCINIRNIYIQLK